jgi:hypothetical protein
MKAGGALQRVSGVTAQRDVEDLQCRAWGLTWDLHRTLDISSDDTARALAVFLKLIEPCESLPHIAPELKRQVAEEVHGALEELAERCRRLAKLVLQAAPLVDVVKKAGRH